MWNRLNKKGTPGGPIVIIMAGGKGERFWPRSTRAVPKQLQKVYSDRTLLDETWDRALAVTSSDRIFIGCNAALRSAILKTHKNIRKSNFILEPEGKNTAPILALAAWQLRAKYPEDVQLILSADHYVQPVTEFANTVAKMVHWAEKGRIVTIGVPPVRPDTGYGYIEAGERHPDGSYEIQSFKEKPSASMARDFVSKPHFFWNAGIFAWKGSVILSEFAAHAPEILKPIQEAKSEADMKKAFHHMHGSPVDIAILEKSDRVMMVPASFQWDDVGSWLSLPRILKADESGNVHVSGRGHMLGIESERNIVLTDKKLIALLGVKDLIVVETEDVIFVSDEANVGKIKEMLGAMNKNSGLQKFL
jgi:mannose-1-phosphate guanylyltransferase